MSELDAVLVKLVMSLPREGKEKIFPWLFDRSSNADEAKAILFESDSCGTRALAGLSS